MIAIVNISAHDQPTGLHRYELRINQRVIATFDHVREEGLGECLRKAAIAADQAAAEKHSALYQALCVAIESNKKGIIP